jgi:hypothetical protein
MSPYGAESKRRDASHVLDGFSDPSELRDNLKGNERGYREARLRFTFSLVNVVNAG